MKSMLISALTVVIAILAMVGQHIYSKHWAVINRVDPLEFDRDAKFTVQEVPTTFYHQGQLMTILPEWRHEFHLYRLHPNETFNLDLVETFGTSKVRAKTVASECKWESTLCTPCFARGEEGVKEIPTSKIFEEKGLYASFAKIDNSIVGKLWNMLGLPFKVEDTNVEHAFIGNFDEDMLTAQIHANSMTSSMGVQFVGSKTWLFVPPKDYLAADGFAAVPAAPVTLPRRSPTRNFDVYVYKSQPGDVLFFPESWAHIVWTHKGPNFLLNYRKMSVGNALRQPITWITAILNMRLFGQVSNHANVKTGAGETQDTAVPEKELNKRAFYMVDGVCIERNNEIPKFDAQMLKFLKDTVKASSK